VLGLAALLLPDDQTEGDPRGQTNQLGRNAAGVALLLAGGVFVFLFL